MDPASQREECWRTCSHFFKSSTALRHFLVDSDPLKSHLPHFPECHHLLGQGTCWGLPPPVRTLRQVQMGRDWGTWWPDPRKIRKPSLLAGRGWRRREEAGVMRLQASHGFRRRVPITKIRLGRAVGVGREDSGLVGSTLSGRGGEPSHLSRLNAMPPPPGSFPCCSRWSNCSPLWVPENPVLPSS